MKRTLLIFFICLLFSETKAQLPGSLDVTFDNDGMLKSLGGNIGESVAIQTDGKILVAGSVFSSSQAFVARYLTDGSIDLTYGTNGVSYFSSLSNSNSINDIILQPDGKLITVGTTGDGFTIYLWMMRLDTNGDPDNTFGTNGSITEQVNFDATYGYSVALQNNGKIVALGSVTAGIYNYDVVLMRFNSDGTPDNTFDADGKAQLTLASEQPTDGGIAIQPDGKILVGTTKALGMSNPGDYDYVVMRVTSSGTLDNTFGTNGITITDFSPGSYDRAYEILLQPDGKCVLSGYQWDGSDFDVSAARFDAGGILDPGFGIGGKITIDNGQLHDDVAYNALLQPDGKILLAGNTSNGGHVRVFLIRTNSNGTPDNSFATGGMLMTDIETQNNNNSSGIAMQADSKIVLSGYTRVCTNGVCGPLSLAMVRVNNTLTTGIQQDLTGNTNSTLYPNPVTSGAINIIYNSEKEELVHLELTDAGSRKVFSCQPLISRVNNQNALTVILPSCLSKGFYILTLASGSNEIIRQKILVE